MTGAPALARGLAVSQTPALPDAADLAEVARIAEAEAGIIIGEGKGSMVQSRLARRLRQLGHASFRSYLAFVTSPEGSAERREMVSALTTNVTHFFRERHHFDLLRDEVLPPLLAAARAGNPVRLWSAGCSAGQEAYSMAMTLLELMPDAPDHDIRILATDIDPGMIALGRAARYDDAALAALPPSHLARFVIRDTGGGVLAAPVRALVRFRELNLHAAWPMRRPFDAVFCRNVVIYFAPQAQLRLWGRFARALSPGGWLVVGHSERVPAGPGDEFVSVGITSYRRAPGGPAWR